MLDLILGEKKKKKKAKNFAPRVSEVILHLPHARKVSAQHLADRYLLNINDHFTQQCLLNSRNVAGAALTAGGTVGPTICVFVGFLVSCVYIWWGEVTDRVST